MTDPGWHKDKYKGRQMYPKDTVTRKQMDRQDDRQTRRIDLHRDRLDKVRQEVAALQAQMAKLLQIIEIEEDGGDT